MLHPLPFMRPFGIIAESMGGCSVTDLAGSLKYPHRSVGFICQSPNCHCSNENGGFPINCRRNPVGFSSAQNLKPPDIRHFHAICRHASTISIAPSKSRGLLPFAIENSVHGGAARMPYTFSGGWYALTSCSGNVISRTSYPASLYSLLHAPVPPHRSRMIFGAPVAALMFFTAGSPPLSRRRSPFQVAAPPDCHPGYTHPAALWSPDSFRLCLPRCTAIR